MVKHVFAAVLCGVPAMAASDIETPHERIDTVDTSADIGLWWNRIRFKGDLRLRYESIERDDKDSIYRTRYRLRLGTTVDVTDNLWLNVGMRSGFGNPTSGNQTFLDEPLSDYFFQSLRFNVLGLTYKNGFSTFKIGREPYMLYRPIKSQLVWDNDISFNGINYRYKDSDRIITVGINEPTQEENSVAEDNVYLYVAQYVRKMNLDVVELHVGAGVYYYDGLKGNTPIFGKAKGNTLRADGRYANDYHMLEGFGELRFNDVFGLPFKVAAGFVYNTAADDNNFGYDVAFQLGKAKKAGQWQMKYSYTDLQEDATLGAYSDSDNFGGGTAARGHAIRVKYKYGKHLYVAGNFFFDTLYESNSRKPGIEPDYVRVQLDMIWTF